MNDKIKVGSLWERIASGNVWTVKDLNPNGTVTIQLRRCIDHHEIEIYETDFLVRAFRELPPENPCARVYYGR